MFALLLAACSTEPPTTGPSRFVGRVVDASGAPVAGLEVASLEARVRTDAEGAIDVAWKPPNQIVHFSRQGMTFERRLQPGDEGQVVTLVVPETREATVHCPDQTCFAELRWDLDAGLQGVMRAACDPHRSHELPAAPVGLPRVSCRAGKGTAARELSLEAVEVDGAIRLVPPSTRVQVELMSLDGDVVPDDCKVQARGLLASESGQGVWTLEVRGPGVISAMCGDRPAVPQAIRPEGPTAEVTLEWSASGPVLELEGRAPWASRIQLVAEVGADAGWVLDLAPDAVDGAVHLPPLVPGVYRVFVLGPGREAAVLAARPPKGPPGVLVLRAEGEEALVGRLELETDLRDGLVPVQVQAP